MGKTYEGIDERMASWIAGQPMFFVATAPATGGHVNVSPKGLDDTFAVIDEHTVAYLDLGGSGAETIAHVRENGRITLMFCAFDGPARIVRFYGRGDTLFPGDAEWDSLRSRFGEYRARNIVRVRVDRIADSCGFGVPHMELVEQRSRLTEWVGARSDEELAAYRAEKNRASIDGLPAIDVPEHDTAASE
ncbi:MAG TPA: pyridoxamine 5'-phosphate oxidase family protein [Acidimicrobiia bacterium]|jgi:hypothetical protein|nr:pyridoxamine 5'-phosphate oxidase family protein [Acidimicrobiia bacterium]